MSAETLRQAADLMQQRAKAAWPSEQWSRQRYANDHPENISLQRSEFVRVVTYCGTAENADHIYSWHPDVALAASQLLDLAATWLEMHPDSNPPWVLDCINLAHTYLGATT